MTDVVIVSGVRTPVGAFGGSLKETTVVQLGSLVLKETLKKVGLRPVVTDDLTRFDPDTFKDISIGDAAFSVSYELTGHSSGSRQLWGMVDEERKLNVNTVRLGDLKRLIQVVLSVDDIEAQELAASIIDWRDKDSMLSLPLGSAEDPYYRNTKYRI